MIVELGAVEKFFYITPERAKSLLEVAELMGGKNVTPTTAIVDSPEDQEALNRARTPKKGLNSISECLG